MRARQENGFTLVELLIVVGIIGVLAAIALHNLLSAKVAANEASAIGTLRALNSAQVAYSSSCGGTAYSTSLTTLVSERYLSPDADVSPKSGFAFALSIGSGTPGPADCDGQPTSSAYYFAGTRVTVTTGNRGFATNENAVVWQDSSGTAPAEPFVASATVSPIQ